MSDCEDSPSCKCRHQGKCKCVILASKRSCHPDDDICHPRVGMMWIKDTQVMYVYQKKRCHKKDCCKCYGYDSSTCRSKPKKVRRRVRSIASGEFSDDEYDLNAEYECPIEPRWEKVPVAQEIFFQFDDAETTEEGTSVATVVKTFIFPATEEDCGAQIRRLIYSHSWTEIVDDAPSEQGMMVTLQDMKTGEPIIIAQNSPSFYEKFDETTDIIYQPNPGDILDITIRKPGDEPAGAGVLNSFKLFLSPFDPDY